MKYFVQSEKADWQKFFEDVDKLLNTYFDNCQSKDI